ncbi:Na/Pi symporter [bacterium]|nr:Na/Pi symporter [bacterium]
MAAYPASSPDTATGIAGPVGLVLRILVLIGLLYLFMLSITMLGAAFKLMGKGVAESILTTTSNPLVGLVIGILATSVIQSSSTTTSLVVGLVGTAALSFENAVPIIMGANIGTTVTNTIVSLAHISRGEEFKRAFAGSTVHDFFNICSVIILLPLEEMFGIISWSSHVVEHIFQGTGGLKFTSPLSAVTKPVSAYLANLLGGNGWIVAIVALLLLFLALRYIVVTLKAMVLSKVERFFHRYIFRNAALGFVLGVALTTLVQSSSITTSLVVPLIGAGVLTMTQIFPYVLGANVGTTITAFLASLAVGSHEAVSIAFAHLLFNVYGICIFWPLKRIPIFLAETMAKWTQRSKLIPVLYILIAFFIIPAGIIYFLG